MQVPLNKGGGGFAETARGLSCILLMNLPGQPPRPAAFSPLVKGDLLVRPLLLGDF